MSYKIGFRLDNGKMLWLTKTYASKSYAEKVMKRERQTLLDAGVKLNVPYVVKTEETTNKQSRKPSYPDTIIFEESTNHIDHKVAIPTNVPGWEKSVKQTIGHCIDNEYIHNYIKDKNGKILFRARDYLHDVVIPLNKQYSKEVPNDTPFSTEKTKIIRDNHKIQIEKKKIRDKLVEKIFHQIVESS